MSTSVEKLNLTRGGRDSRASAYAWKTLGKDEVGDPVEIINESKVTLQVAGEFDGAVVKLQGSISPADADYQFLTDHKNNQVIALNTPQMLYISENPMLFRPVVVGGTDDTNIQFYLYAVP